MKRLITAVCGVVLVFTLCAMLAWASPAVGVTPTLIGRVMYEPFKVKTDPHSLVDFQAKAKSHFDMVVRAHQRHRGSGCVLRGRRSHVHAACRLGGSGLRRYRARTPRPQRIGAAREGRVGDPGAG